jgi:hypothetical protein
MSLGSFAPENLLTAYGAQIVFQQLNDLRRVQLASTFVAENSSSHASPSPSPINFIANSLLVDEL